MKNITQAATLPAAPYKPVLGVLLVLVLTSLLYGYGWQFGLPLWLRNASGLLLFFCIMGGAAVAYLVGRIAGLSSAAAARWALLVPLGWHLKEMLAAGEIFGFVQGIYSGFQGFYLIYYGAATMAMAVVHLLYNLVQRCRVTGHPVFDKPLLWLMLPLLGFMVLESSGFFLFGVDLLMFQFFLKGYSLLFMA